MSGVFMLITIVIVVQPFPLGNVTGCDQKNMAFTIHIVPHTFDILFLLAFPTQKPKQLQRWLKNKMSNFFKNVLGRKMMLWSNNLDNNMVCASNDLVEISAFVQK